LFTNLTTSTSTTTGALVVRGGVGIGGDLNVGGSSGNIVRKATTKFSTSTNTVVSLDTIRARVGIGGVPEVTAVAGIISVVWTTVETTVGVFNSNREAAGSLNYIEWSDVFVTNPLTDPGDCIVVNLQDITNGVIYRITYSKAPYAYSIVIERLL
jgi:hypothetical protein